MAKTITWEAEEYVIRNKTVGWYVGLIVVGLLLTGLAVLLQAWTFIAVIVLSVVALMIYVVRPPRVIKYTLDNEGLLEGQQRHSFEEYKAFGVLNENGHYSIVLTPRKRFSPRTMIFFPEAQGEQIVDAFGERLPMEPVQLDLLDKLIKFLRI